MDLEILKEPELAKGKFKSEEYNEKWNTGISESLSSHGLVVIEDELAFHTRLVSVVFSSQRGQPIGILGQSRENNT